MEEILKQLLEGQSQILARLDNVEKSQKEVIQQVVELTQSAARIELAVDEIEKTVGGSQKDIVALLERTATKESITRLDTKIDLINNKLFQAETDLALLKVAK